MLVSIDFIGDTFKRVEMAGGGNLKGALADPSINR
jgi:hypothetical protein